MDRNTIRYMVDDMKEKIEQGKAEIAELQEEIEKQKVEKTELQEEIARLKALLEEKR